MRAKAVGSGQAKSFAGRGVVKRFGMRRLLCVVLLLGAAVAGTAVVVGQDPLRLSRNIAGDSKPIVIDADEITTWTDNGQRILLLKGKVLIQQSVVQAWFQQGVVWVDLDQLQRTRVLHVDVFGEGGVLVDNGGESLTSDKALLDLNTRGELKLNAHKSKVIQKAGPDDPLFQRGLKERALPAIQQTSAPDTLPPVQQCRGRQPRFCRQCPCRRRRLPAQTRSHRPCRHRLQHQPRARPVGSRPGLGRQPSRPRHQPMRLLFRDQPRRPAACHVRPLHAQTWA